MSLPTINLSTLIFLFSSVVSIFCSFLSQLSFQLSVGPFQLCYLSILGIQLCLKIIDLPLERGLSGFVSLDLDILLFIQRIFLRIQLILCLNQLSFLFNCLFKLANFFLFSFYCLVSLLELFFKISYLLIIVEQFSVNVFTLTPELLIHQLEFSSLFLSGSICHILSDKVLYLFLTRMDEH